MFQSVGDGGVRGEDQPSLAVMADREEVKSKRPSLPLIEPMSRSQNSSPQLYRPPPRSSSPTPSTESESSSVAEGTSTGGRRTSPPPCSLKERVCMLVNNGAC